MPTRTTSPAKGPSYTMDDLQAYADRFWAKIKEVGSCLVWQRPQPYRNKTEPQLNFVLRDGRQASIMSARMGWALLNGRLPTFNEILTRTCETTDCVNPYHYKLEDRQALNAARLPLMRQRSAEVQAKKKAERVKRATVEQNRRAKLQAKVAETTAAIVQETAPTPIATIETTARVTLRQLKQLLDLVRETAARRQLDFDLSLGYLVDLYEERPGTLAIVRVNPARGFVRGNVEFATDLVQLAS